MNNFYLRIFFFLVHRSRFFVVRFSGRMCKFINDECKFHNKIKLKYVMAITTIGMNIINYRDAIHDISRHREWIHFPLLRLSKFQMLAVRKIFIGFSKLTLTVNFHKNIFLSNV